MIIPSFQSRRSHHPSCFNDYRTVALTPILMKCFVRLVMHHIKAVLPFSLDPFQFAYRSNRSTSDTITTALHPAPHISGQKRLVCQNTVHRLQFSIQHNHPSTAHSQIGPTRTQHLSVQLAVGLPYWDTSGSMVSSNTSSTITLKPPKDVCWAPSSSLCWPTTAHRHIISTFSLSLRTTWLWWVLLTTKMRQTTSARWAAWLGGGSDNNLSLWMWRRWRRLLLTSRECTLSLLLWPSMVWLWREWAAPSCCRRSTVTLQHFSTGQESAAASLLPPQTEKSQSPGPQYVHLLQRHHREHSD